jgi:hypothetical protein
MMLFQICCKSTSSVEHAISRAGSTFKIVITPSTTNIEKRRDLFRSPVAEFEKIMP